VLRLFPRRVLDRLSRRQLTALAARGHFDGSPLARDLGARLLG